MCEDNSPTDISHDFTQSTHRRHWNCKKCVDLEKRFKCIESEYQNVRAFLLSNTTGPERPINSFRSTKNLYVQSDQLRITLDTVMRAQLFQVQELLQSHL